MTREQVRFYDKVERIEKLILSLDLTVLDLRSVSVILDRIRIACDDIGEAFWEVRRAQRAIEELYRP